MWHRYSEHIKLTVKPLTLLHHLLSQHEVLRLTTCQERILHPRWVQVVVKQLEDGVQQANCAQACGLDRPPLACKLQQPGTFWF
jgi:hypothetical protein